MNVSREKVRKKKKLSIKKYSIPHLGLGGLSHKKRIIRRAKKYVDKKSKDTVYGTDMLMVLSLYPKKFGYSLGGYSHRERCRAPDRKKLVKERMKSYGEKTTEGCVI
jgi:hypothetical protein